jgi:hypothetical protein
MTTKEFNQKRNVTVTSDQGTFEFNSFAEMIGFFDDVKNTEQWAKVEQSANLNLFSTEEPKEKTYTVWVAHRFDTIGKIAESGLTKEEADEFAAQLNEYFAICEEYHIEEN